MIDTVDQLRNRLALLDGKLPVRVLFIGSDLDTTKEITTVTTIASDKQPARRVVIICE